MATRIEVHDQTGNVTVATIPDVDLTERDRLDRNPERCHRPQGA